MHILHKLHPYRKHKPSKEKDPPSNPYLVVPSPAKFKSPLISIFGYSAEGKHRLLVYEYMS